MRRAGLLAGALAALALAPTGARAGDQMFRAYSHNDYEQPHPLLDALENRFYGVEADIWWSGGEIKVSHLGFSYKGTLKELYLDPLQKRVSQSGSVHGDGKPFCLWLDLKESGADLRAALHALLAGYPMLSRFTDAGTQAGPVTIVLTGSESSKRLYLEESATRDAIRDSNDFDPRDPAADNRWLWYALKWPSYVDWDGDGAIKPAELAKFESLVTQVHAKGRQLRFWKTPETPAFWSLALTHGVDVIGTDELVALRKFLEVQLSPLKMWLTSVGTDF